jgi:streptogramin lyase
MTRHITRALAVTALAALAACSGGGSALSTPAANALPQAGNGQATLSFTRLAPQTGTAAKTRRPNEFSFAANSLVVDATNPNASPYHAVFDISGAVITNGLNCSADVSGIYQTCSVQVLLPLGNDSVTVATNSARDGSGTTLGSATAAFTVVDKQNNVLAMALDGAVKSMKLFVSDPNPATGTAVNLPLTVQLYDATGTVLIAPQNYTSPVTITDPDTGSSTSLFTQTSQNSTQRYQGTGVAAAPSAKAKSISVPDRYTQPFFFYDGTTSAAVTLTATFGTLTATVTITPSAQAARTAGANGQTTTLASPAPRAYDPIFDKNGNLWTTVSGGIASLNATTHQITATYSVPAGRSFRAPVIGPDGAIWAVSGTANNGTTGAPFYVTRFDPVSHAFTDYATPSDEVIRLVSTPSGLWGVERNAAKLWQLPFSGASPVAAATANEYPVVAPPQADSTPVLASLPTRIFPSADGNLWVVSTSFATVNGAWVSKYSPAGAKIGNDVRVNPARPTAILDAQAIDSTGKIWFTDSTSQNEFERYDTAAGTVAIFAVPRLYGSNARSLITTYSTVDASDNFWFINSLDGRIGRIDHVTGRVDLLNGPNNNYNSMTISGTTFVLDGFTNAAGSTAGTSFVFTMNT